MTHPNQPGVTSAPGGYSRVNATTRCSVVSPVTATMSPACSGTHSCGVPMMDEFDRITSRFRDQDTEWDQDDPEWDLDGDGLVATPATLAVAVRDALRDAGIVDTVVTGTVTGLARRGRTVSFELAETLPGEATPLATIQVVFFGAEAGRDLVAGSTARVSGHLEWKPDWGQLRLIGSWSETIEARSTATDLRDRLVRDLTDSGVLAAQSRLGLVDRPVRVGLVTGPGSAAEADVASTLAADSAFRLVVRHAPMSGPRAAGAVAGQIGEYGRDDSRPDVVIVARGGGARSDLDWADSEIVARAIAACPVPVWTALGHATDTTVADLAAHRACVTPTAAAAGLIEHVVAHTHRVRVERVELGHRADLAAQRRRHVVIAVLVAAIVVVAVLLG